MLRRMMGRKRKTGAVLVYLNVYDLTPMNEYAYWLGLGIYHSGVQVHGIEYAFGAHEHSTTGIFEVEPKKCPGFTFRKSILVGRTDLGPKEVRAFMEKLSEEYSGNTYNLIAKNCNHFCNDVCVRLTSKPIPKWVNRLAHLGLNETKVRHIRAEDRAHEKKKLRSNSSRFASSDPNQPAANPSRGSKHRNHHRSSSSKRSSSPSTTKF